MKFSRSDVSVTLLICLLTSVILFFFWKDINTNSSYNKSEALGTIVFKKRSATRRSPSNLNWERLINNSKVYNLDLIRTSDFSEAQLFFDDGSNLDLFENTMLKLDFLNPEESILEFTEGRVSISGGNGKVIKTGDKTIEFSEDSRVSFSKVENEISIEVDKGNATIIDILGESTILDTSTEFILNTETGISQKIIHTIDLQRPEQNIRLLYDKNDTSQVIFSWNSNVENTDELFLEISPNENFSNMERYSVSGNSIALKQQIGTWYWRVSDNKEILSSISRFSLSKEQFTQLILPKNQEKIYYRRIPPSIIFSWSPMESANSYILEISAEKDFNNPIIKYKTNLNNITLNALDEGTWYWKVTPIISQQIGGDINLNSKINTIYIVKKDEMNPIKLNYPTNNRLYTLESIKNNGLSMSWESNSEAGNYEVKFSTDSLMSNPLKIFNTENPYINIPVTAATFLSTEGEYYWSIRWSDNEKNYSPWSSVRRIQNINQNFALRLSYPQNSYVIADSLITNTRFTWKTNIPGRTQFQLSTDSEFQNILYEDDVQTETLLGKDWPTGDKYWRIRTFNSDKTLFMQTEPRLITISEPLKPPTLLIPNPSETYYYREGDTQIIKWQKVEKADYYSMEITPAGSSEPIYINSMIEKEELKIDFDNFSDGNYTIKLQGFSFETPASTRIIGYLKSSKISLKSIKYLTLNYPLNDTSFQGLTALREGLKFKWNGDMWPENSQLKIYDINDKNNAVYSLINPKKNINVPSLKEGEYFWTIEGSFKGFNITPKDMGHFTVLPIPLLQSPNIIFPTEKFIINTEYLINSKSIKFEWKPIVGATHYVIELYKKGELKPLYTSDLIKETHYILEDLTSLDKGSFEYVVYGKSLNMEGIQEQMGKKELHNFSIILPTLDTIEFNIGGVYFGY